MSLLPKIVEDIKQAMRDKDEMTRDTLRMIKSELTTFEKPDEIAVLTRAVKSRRDSAASYKEGGRQDLVDREEAEIAIIQRYLPKELSADEAQAAVEALVKELGIESKKDLGRLMKAVMEKYRGQIDGKAASLIAAKLLG